MSYSDQTKLQQETLDLLVDLLRCPSVTPEDAGCLEIIQNYLGSDVTYEWLNYGDTKNVMISHGSAEPHLMFLGHVDVVPAGDESTWTSPPFAPEQRNGKLFARGTCDMKSGVAAMTVALKHFIADNPNHKGRISLLLTSDEEGTNINGIPKVVEHFKSNGTKIDFCIVGEPSSQTNFLDTIKIGRRGTLNGKLKIFGIQGHVAYPKLADNPIHKFAPVLSALTSHSWDQGDEFFEATSLQFSNIAAGIGVKNVIPGHLEASFNFRFSPKHCFESLTEGFESFLRNAGLQYELAWNLNGLPFLTKPGLLTETIIQEIEKITSKKPKLDTGGGTSDARFIAPLGTEVLEVGLRGESLHKVDEFCRVEELAPLAQLYINISKSILAAE
jgi:succinyl-diaminopimelate desuccinylase